MSVIMSVCPSFSLSVCPSNLGQNSVCLLQVLIFLSAVRLSVCLSIIQSAVCLSIIPSVCLSVHPPVYPFFRPSVCLSTFPSVCLSIILSGQTHAISNLSCESTDDCEKWIGGL